MRPITRTRIDDSVYEQLLQDIRTGKWKSGDKLPSEGELCSIFQVSRMPVRSALQRLQALGFIEVKRAKGAYICGADELFDFSGFDDSINLSLKEFGEIEELREMIEGASVEILVSRPRSSVDFSKFTEAYLGMREAVAGVDAAAFTKHDHAYHMSIVFATGNEKFLQIVQIFREDIHRFLRESNKFLLRDMDDPVRLKKHFTDSLAYHTDLYEALLRHDSVAIRLQRSHFERVRQRFSRYFQEERGRGVADASIPSFSRPK